MIIITNSVILKSMKSKIKLFIFSISLLSLTFLLKVTFSDSNFGEFIQRAFADHDTWVDLGCGCAGGCGDA